MMRAVFALLLLLGLAGLAAGQVDQLPANQKGPAESEAPPRYEHPTGVSSSRDTKIDIAPPNDDAKAHPSSGAAVSDASDHSSDDIQEMHPWNPHKAAKDIEVGDFYFKRKNYHAALDRYNEALLYKPDDALANFRLGECFEKLGDSDQSAEHYQQYLKVLPHGPLAESAQKALHKLKADNAQAAGTNPAKQ